MTQPYAENDRDPIMHTAATTLSNITQTSQLEHFGVIVSDIKNSPKGN